jgi:tRNA nucleotidyltransferase/poly(A) polymerase
MGFDKMFQVLIRFKQAEFYRKVNQLLHEKYGWDYYFKQIKIIYVSKDVREALPELETKLQKELLNQKVIECLNTNAENFYNKKKEEYEQRTKNLLMGYWGEVSENEKKSGNLWRVPETYLTAQNFLTEELIRIGHKNMTFSEKEFLENNSELDGLFMCDK